MSALEKVKSWAPPSSRIEPLTEVAIKDVDIFWVAFPPSGPDDDHGRGVAVVDGNGPLFKEEAMRAVVGRGLADAVGLARAAQVLLGPGGAPLIHPDKELDSDEKGSELARPPSLSGGKLEFWSYETRSGRPRLTRWRLDVKTLQIESIPATQVLKSR